MKIRNTTNIPNETVKRIVSFVRPPGISKFDVMVKNGKRGIAGRAYLDGSSYHSTRNPFVVCRVPVDNKFPRKLSTYQIGHLKGKRYHLADRLEALVYITAHELRHLWQHKAKNKSGYFWGSRGRYSEIDTESYAIKKLREWRKNKTSA